MDVVDVMTLGAGAVTRRAAKRGARELLERGAREYGDDAFRKGARYADDAFRMATRYVDNYVDDIVRQVSRRADNYVDDIYRRAENWVDDATRRGDGFADDITRRGDDWVDDAARRSDNATRQFSDKIRTLITPLSPSRQRALLQFAYWYDDTDVKAVDAAVDSGNTDGLFENTLFI